MSVQPISGDELSGDDDSGDDDSVGHVAPVRWLDDTEMRAWRSFMEVSYRLLDTLNRELQDNHGMSLAEYRILVLLSEAPDGSLRMSSLADGVLSSRSRLTHQIRRMQTQGMVERSTCVDDGRGVLAVITDEGRARLESAAPLHVRGVRAHLLDLLNRSEQRTLGDVFGKVDRHLGPRNY